MSQADPPESIDVENSPGDSEGSDSRYFSLTPSFHVAGLYDIPQPEHSHYLPAYVPTETLARHLWRRYHEAIKKDASQEQANFSNRSSPLFNMYVKMTEEEDNKMTDRWQKDGDGILIFVSPYLGLNAGVANVNIVDRLIFCCPRSIARDLRSRAQAKFAGHLCILSRKYLSTPC
jgi:hypothetical protein